MVAVRTRLPSVPVITTVVVTPTAEVVMSNVALEAPSGTVIVAGTIAAASFELMAIDCPPEKAGPSRVTMPVRVTPPTAEVGLIVSVASPAGTVVTVLTPRPSYA